MDYQPSDTEAFIFNFHFFNENLPLEDGARRAYISIGSNLFVKFGEEYDTPFPNGRPCKSSPWTIWLAGTSWRLSKKSNYIIGSSDPYDEMNENLKCLLGKKFITSRIISQFMDIQIDFEDGYQLTSFFNSISVDQWTLFASNENTIGVDNETKEEIQQIIELSKHFEIIELPQPISLPIDGKTFINFICDAYTLTLNFENNVSLVLDNCKWRIEQNKDYCIGCIDNALDRVSETAEKYLDQIIGKKLIHSSMVKPFADAKLEFEDGWVIKTFSSWKEEKQWCILDNNNEKHSANFTFTAEVN